MKKVYVKPEIKLFDIRMEDKIASVCKSFVEFNYNSNWGNFCEAFRYSEDGVSSRPQGSCLYRPIENS